MSKPNNLFVAIGKEYWPFLLPLLLLLPGLNSFPYPGSGAQYSDFAITHYPNALFLKDALLRESALPLWSPQVLGGFPFIAHPYSGIWYPFYWLALLFPLPLGLNLLVMVHLAWAGIGVYKLLRQAGLGRQPAIFGGLAFEMTPALFANLGAGHLMLLLAACWTPWLLWAGHQIVESRWGRLVQPGVVLGIIFCADPRWAIYAGALWLTWALAVGQAPRLSERLVSAATQIGLAVAVTAPALWLYAEYGCLSTRAAITASEVLALSLPPAALLGLVMPQPFAFHEWVLYPGVLVLALAISSRWRQNRFHERFWLLAIAASLLLSLGANIPGMQFVAELPGFSQLRVPPRALLITAFAFSMLAAGGLEVSLNSKPSIKRLRLTLAALIGLCLVLAVAAASLHIDLWRSCLWAAGLLATLAILQELYLSGKLRPFAFAATALLILDLAVMDMSLVRLRTAQEVLAEDSDVAAFLAAQPERFRVYSPSYSIAQQTAAQFNLELADGVDPLQLAAYANFMEAASGVPASGYSVSLPPFAGDPSRANAAYAPDPAKLGLLNVEYVASEFPLEINGLDEIKQISGSFVYRNEFVRPRAWVEDAEGSWRSVDEIDWNYNRILVRAAGPGLLVLSELTYPGWQVHVDGQRVELQTYANLLRAVQLSAGVHEVTFSFEPLALRVALPLPLITLTALLVWPHPNRKKRKT